MKIAIYFCSDIIYSGERSPDDVFIRSIDTWESLLALLAIPPVSSGIAGPRNAVLSALANGNFTVGTMTWAGATGDKDYGYYAVIEE